MATAAERRAARAALKKQEALSKDTKRAAENHEPAAPPPAEETNKKVIHSARDTVTVACKVPNGIIIQNAVLIDAFEPVFGGGSRPIKKAEPSGPQIHLNGPSRAPGADPEAKRVVGGYGLTHNVPRKEFELWLHNNAELDIVKKNLIFAHGDTDRAADQARDQKTFRSGLEPLNVDGRKPGGSYIDPRMPKNVKKYKPDDESTDIRGVA